MDKLIINGTIYTDRKHCLKSDILINEGVIKDFIDDEKVNSLKPTMKLLMHQIK